MRHITPLHVLLFTALPSLAHAQDLVPAWGGSMGSDGSDVGSSIALDATGHVHATGNFSGTIDIDPGTAITNLSSAGSNDVYVTKFDTTGNLIWARSFGGVYSDGATSIAVDAAGSVYIAGGFSGTADFDPGAGVFEMTAATTDQNDIYICKLDAAGNFVWAKGIIGGTWWDNAFDIAVDPYGDVIVTGRFYYQGGPRDFDPGPGTFFLTAGHEDIFILKLDTEGDFIWAEAFGTAPDESRGYAIALDDEGNIFSTGYFRGTVDFDPGPDTFNMTSVGTWNVFYMKLDTAGALLWAKSLPISTTTYYTDGSYGRKITVDANGDLLATGRFSGTIDFDPDAGTAELTSSGDFDVYVVKFTSTGGFVWARSAGGAGYDEGFCITTNSAGDIVLTGTYEMEADLDPGVDTLEATSAGDADAFILRLDNTGSLLQASSFGGAGYDRGYAVAPSASGALYLTGWFTGTTDLDPGNGTAIAISAGSNDAFLIKLVENTGVGMEEPAPRADNEFRVFPNPATRDVSIACDASSFGKRGVVEVFDATGKRMLAEQVPSFSPLQQLELPTDLPEGLYSVMVRIEKEAPRSARIVLKR